MKLKNLPKLIGEKEASGAQGGKIPKRVLLTGFLGTLISISLFLGCVYEVNNGKSLDTLIFLFGVFAILMIVLTWYMSFLENECYKKQKKLHDLRKVVVKLKNLKKKKEIKNDFVYESEDYNFGKSIEVTLPDFLPEKIEMSFPND